MKKPENVLIGSRYKLIRLVNTGGQGAVYKAEDLHTDSEVAVKILHRNSQPDNSDEIDRHFLAGASISKNIVHSGVVTTIDFGNDPEKGPFIVMEYLHGKPLSTLLERNMEFSPPVIEKILNEVLKTLVYLHSIDFIHGDIKPENIFIINPDSNNFRVKLLDIIPKRRWKDWKLSGITPEYLDPAIHTTKTPFKEMDFYSCGLVGYELLTGKLPVPDRNGEFPFNPEIFKNTSLHNLIRALLSDISDRNNAVSTLVSSKNSYQYVTDCIEHNSTTGDLPLSTPFSLMVKQNPFPVMLLQRDLTINFANNAAINMFGEIIGKSFGENVIAIHMPDIIDSVMDSFEKVVFSETPFQMESHNMKIWTTPLVEEGKVIFVQLIIISG
ncbi:MAG: protein kinase [Deltaproteobacteria bacterium]|nr:protein kinase [Deltaproteobacteria bacterium]